MIENKDIPGEYIDWMDRTISAIHDFTRPALPMMREVAIAAYRHLVGQSSKAGDEVPEDFESFANAYCLKVGADTPRAFREHLEAEICTAMVAAYRHLKAQPSPVLRWVKASGQLPEGKEVGKIVTIKPIVEGFDFYMFLKYVQDFDNDGQFRWNLWDGHHGWTRKISPELLSKIIWLEEEAPSETQPDPTHTAQ